MRLLRVALGTLAVGMPATWALYGAALWGLQETMIFAPPGGVSEANLDGAARELGATPLHLRAEDGTGIYAWYRDVGADRALIWCHGNGSTVAHSASLQRQAAREGWNLLAFAYRGYPGSDGVPTEEGLAADARAAWSWLTDEAGIAPERIVLHGHSLGGAVCARLAEERNPAALVLESTFLSMTEMARSRAPLYPVSWLLRHPFDTAGRGPRVGVPVLLLHSVDDQLIPVDHARRLQDHFADVRYVEVEGLGHDAQPSVYDPVAREAWLGFLERHVPKGAEDASP